MKTRTNKDSNLHKMQSENIMVDCEEDQSLNIIQNGFKRSQTSKSGYQSKYAMIAE